MGFEYSFKWLQTHKPKVNTPIYEVQTCHDVQINVYKFQCSLKFEKFISPKHQFVEIKLHAWCHNIRAGQQVWWPISQPNYQQALGKT
jgi:hypothetical protein